MNTKGLSWRARQPKKCRIVSGASDAWWYVETNGITVLAQPDHIYASPTFVKLTKAQLKSALRLMEKV
jgi:hypothetical protein